MKTDPQQLLVLLTSRGLSPAGAAGFGGNFQIESGLDPAAVGDNGTSLGLAQWHGDRKAALVNFATSQGKSPTDAGVQVDFLMNELHQPQYAGLLSQLQTETDPKAAAVGVLGFERPKGWTAQNPLGGMGAGQRLAAASAFFGGSGSGPLASPSQGTASTAPSFPAVPATQPDEDAPAPAAAAPMPAMASDQQQQSSAPELLASLPVRRGLLALGSVRPIASILGRRAPTST